MIAQEIAFSHGEIQLAGTLYKPEAPARRPAVIVLHAANGGERAFPFYRHLAAHLPKQGIAVLLYDRRGCGRSSGELPADVTRDKWYYELDHDPLPAWQKVAQPYLFIFAGDDRWAPVPESLANFQAATQHIAEATFVKMEGTDHLMADRSAEGPGQVSGRHLAVLTSWLAARNEDIRLIQPRR